MRKIATFAATTLLISSAFAAGEVYRWRGTDGAWHYSDQPRPGAELVRGSQPPLNQAAEAAAAETSAPRVNNQGLPVSDAVAAEVRAAASAAKTDQCKKATLAYEQAIKARRIYKTDNNGKQKLDEAGNPIFMSNAEIDNERLQVRAMRDQACAPGA